jgi:flavin reductase (DIM6/NTAB) family NADH-FMN oxidoreductase RutF
MNAFAPVIGEILEEGPWLKGDDRLDPSAALSEPFRVAMRRLAAGTCAVTVRQGDEILGLTATSVTSLSLAPPSLLVSIRAQSFVLKALRREKAFSVHILGEDQTHEANALAGRLGTESRASLVTWHHSGAASPRLAGATCHIDCMVAKFLPVFSHIVVVGVVATIELSANDRPLVYFDGAFHTLSDQAK